MRPDAFVWGDLRSPLTRDSAHSTFATNLLATNLLTYRSLSPSPINEESPAGQRRAFCNLKPHAQEVISMSRYSPEVTPQLTSPPSPHQPRRPPDWEAATHTIYVSATLVLALSSACLAWQGFQVPESGPSSVPPAVTCECLLPAELLHEDGVLPSDSLERSPVLPADQEYPAHTLPSCYFSRP